MADGFEVLAGASYLVLLRGAKVGFQQVLTLGLGNEIDVLHAALTEHYSPVGIVSAHRRVDVEATRQLGINHHLFLLFQFFGEAHLYASTIHYHKIV